MFQNYPLAVLNTLLTLILASLIAEIFSLLSAVLHQICRHFVEQFHSLLIFTLVIQINVTKMFSQIDKFFCNFPDRLLELPQVIQILKDNKYRTAVDLKKIKVIRNSFKLLARRYF